jgi:hypothetical protein
VTDWGKYREWDRPAPDDFVLIPNWDRFQHYGRDRKPIWIKVYMDLLSDPDFIALSMAERGLLMTIWLAYARCEGILPIATLSRSYGRPGVGLPQLFSLNQAGLIEFSDSRPLAIRARSREVEVEVDKESPKPPYKKNLERELLRRALEVAAAWVGGASEDFDEEIDALERELHVRLSQSQRMKLWDVARARE